MERTLEVMPGTYAVSALPRDSSLPDWARDGEGFLSVTWAFDELSVVCRQDSVPGDVTAERGWSCLRISGKLPFELVGVLAGLLQPLAAAAVPVFVISTFATDYLLVRRAILETAAAALVQAGYDVRFDSDV